MQDEERNTGKRPRDAHTGMIASVPKKFKATETQTNIIVQLPSYCHDLVT